MTGRRRGQGGILGASAQPPVQRQDVDALRHGAVQAAHNVLDFSGSGQEDERVAGALGERPLRGGGDMGEEFPRHAVRAQAGRARRRGRPHLLKRME